MLRQLLLFVCGIVLCSVSLFAQQGSLADAWLYPDSSLEGGKERRILFQGDFIQNASSLPNYFIGQVYQASFLDDEIKNTAFNRLRANNRLGLDAQASLAFSWQSKDIRYSLAAGHREFFAMSYTDDVFRLIFEGNSRFAGQKASLDKVNVRSFNYQFFQVGAEKNIRDTWRLGAQARILRAGRGIRMQSAGSLFTEANGEYLEYNGSLKLQHTINDTSKTLEHQGTGFALDLYSRMRIGKNILELTLGDLGALFYNTAKTYEADGTYRYEGIVITDIISPEATISTAPTADSIIARSGVSLQNKKLSMRLPVFLQAGYRIVSTGKLNHYVSLRYMLGPGYLPQLQYRNLYRLGKAVQLANTISIGGFGRLDHEIGALVQIRKKYVFTLQTQALEYLIAPRITSGHALRAALVATF
ncbi:MAG: DUF5723 family protein [Cytophagaceae bacterium]|jgi:hypothetical protein|nr:DUF5723 family protein [Cytophagaceae bacterium]